jgi:two-component system nitrogen regulation response regulator NtrX
LHRKEKKILGKESMDAMMAYPWPGNVRELKNLIERLMIMVPGNEITVAELPESIKGRGADEFSRYMNFSDLGQARESFEKEFIARKLGEFGGNISKTAELLNISRENLSRKVKKLRLKDQEGE